MLYSLTRVMEDLYQFERLKKLHNSAMPVKKDLIKNIDGTFCVISRPYSTGELLAKELCQQKKMTDSLKS